MALETDTLISKLNGGRAAPIGPLVSALIQPLMVQFGTIFRFHMNNGRQPDGDSLPRYLWVVGVALWLGAVASFVVTTWSVLEHIGPLEDYADPTIREEATALYILAWVQVLYPMVSFVDFVWMYSTQETYSRQKTYRHDEYSARLSTIKDIIYGTADVTTKAGLALIAFLVATRE